ncbi:MAG TPA: segregation/condensation protein A [Bryobacterales bacterium]|nr:segregation/condensation protein A [Bryobacterales bacterium]
MDASPLNVHLEQYDGPLDLLLDLIRRQQIDIYDIPIARITSQYLDYLHKAESLNIDLGGEFVLMAATLIQIKSRLLLPAEPVLPGEEPEDPRAELVNRLLEHEKYKNAAQMLHQKQMIEENVWSNPQITAFLDEDDEPGLAVTIVDLVRTFEQILERAKNRPQFEVAGEDVSVARQIQYLKNILLATDEPLSLQELFEKQVGRRPLVALFLAVLELVRMQAILLRQKETFGDVLIRKHKMFDVIFQSEEPIMAVDEGYV